MPLYRTQPGVSIDDLVAMLESRGEEIISVLPAANTGTDGFTVITRPMLRVVTNLETR